MDHLPYPVGAALEPVEIPFLACETYDSSGFDTWPGRRGWAEDVWRDNALSSDDIARRAQEWLFFGLLKACLHFDNDFNDFVYTTPDHRILVTTSLLSLLCRQWCMRVRSKRVTSTAVKEIRLALDVVKDKLPNLLASPHAGVWPSSHIFFSIYCLASSLLFFINTREYSKGTHSTMLKVEFPRHSLLWLENRLRHTGWCPRQVELVIRKYPPFVMYYLSSIPRSEPTDITHAHCPRLRCSANNVDEADYIIRHYEDCESCDFVHSPLAELMKITENGGIPLLNVYEDSNQDIRYQFVEYKIGMTFGAVSHVWSGGLGNFKANAMPRCQVTRLYHAIYQAIRDQSTLSKIKGLHGNRTLFWIDTLCIPIKPPEIRVAAISRMAQIYAAATIVLVLDRELEATPFQNLAKEQTISHIVASAWSCRSWTLHEAALAQNLVFQFRDGLFKLRLAPSHTDYSPAEQLADMINWLMPSSTLFSFDHIMRSDLEDSLGGMRPVGAFSVPYFEAVLDTKFTDYEVERCEQFTSVWNSLADRDTTKKDDLHGILATLLDLRASEVLSLPRNTRMKAIIKAQSRLPFNLLCTPQSSGSEDLSLRWLPQFPEVVMKSWGGSLELSDSGLLINHSDAQRGLLLEKHDRFQKLVVDIQTIPSELIYVQLHYSETDAFVDPPNTRSYIIIDESTSPMQGFRLCILDPFLRQGVYDCPVTVWKSKPPEINYQGTRVIKASLRPLTKDFLIRSGEHQPMTPNLNILIGFHQRYLPMAKIGISTIHNRRKYNSIAQYSKTCCLARITDDHTALGCRDY